MNPAVDIGQVEGCFIMGAGAFLTEEQVRQYAKVIHVYLQGLPGVRVVSLRVCSMLSISALNTHDVSLSNTPLSSLTMGCGLYT